MVAHSLGHTYLYDCELTGTVALNTHNSMSPEYSYIHMFGGKLNSTAASILCAEDGKAVMNLDHVVIGDIADGNLAYAHSGGRLVANLAEMTVSGNLDREEKSLSGGQSQGNLPHRQRKCHRSQPGCCFRLEYHRQ